MKNGNKITIKTIAQTFGVSESTVSRAFNPNSRISDTMRKQILEYAKQNNFVLNKAAAGLRMKELNIGFLCVTTDPPYAYAIEEFSRGLCDACSILSSLKFHLHSKLIKHTISGQFNKTAELRETLNNWQNFDGIIVSGANDAADIECINSCAEQGTHIVLLQNNQPQIKKLFVSCLDATTSSMMAVEFIASCLKKSERKNVVLFTGDRSSWLHFEADRVFRNADKQCVFDLIASYDMKDSSELLYQQIIDLFESRELKPDAVFISSGVSDELCRYIKDNGLQAQTVVVTFDISPQITQYLKEGIVTATINQDLYSQAKNALTGLIDYLTGNNSVDSICTPAPTLILKSNLDYYLKK